VSWGSTMSEGLSPRISLSFSGSERTAIRRCSRRQSLKILHSNEVRSVKGVVRNNHCGGYSRADISRIAHIPHWPFAEQVCWNRRPSISSGIRYKQMSPFAPLMQSHIGFASHSHGCIRSENSKKELCGLPISYGLDSCSHSNGFRRVSRVDLSRIAHPGTAAINNFYFACAV
jgi:hypothetical protein